MLELNNVSAGYGRKVVLDGVTVSFEKGRFVRKTKFSLNPDGSLKEK